MASLTGASVLQVLSHHIGAEMGVRVDVLAKEVEHSTGHPMSERDIRHAVVELRLEGLHVCAHPRTGYFLASTEDELVQCCEYLYERAMTTLTQISRMRKVSEPDLRGQLRLPT